MKRRFDVILFDLGDTLMYFDGDFPAIQRACNRELARYLGESNLSVDSEVFLSEFEGRMDAYYRQRETEFLEYTTAYVLRNLLIEWGYSEPLDALIEQALASMYRISQQHWIPEADALPTLQALKLRGYRLGAISNVADENNASLLVDKLGARQYMDIIVTSAGLGLRKPNPKIFWHTLSHWNCPPERAAMVGDTLGSDVLGARNAGIFSIWITRRADTPGNRDHLDTIQPDLTVTTLEELLNHLP
jgi:HAD superfamily hydrolase (TIGR01549 family)